MSKSPTKPECSICANPMRDPVKCPSAECDFECCSKCVKTFLLGLPDTCGTAYCMSCKANWDLLIDRKLSTTFLNGDWRKKRARFLLIGEKARLGDAQAQARLAERMLEAKHLKSGYALKVAEHDYYRSAYELKAADYKELVHAVRNGDPSEHIFDRLAAPVVKYEDRFKESDATAAAPAAPKSSKSNSTSSRGPCPAKDCRGILAHDWKCGLCQTQVCEDCREIQSASAIHECDPEVVKSVKLMVADSRPCPSCGVGIQRTEGCSHMFCTSCKTGFDWNTMKKIADSRNTNPYLAAYTAQNHRREAAPAASASSSSPSAACNASTPERLNDVLLRCGDNTNLYNALAISKIMKMEEPEFVAPLCGLFANLLHLVAVREQAIHSGSRRRDGVLTLEEKTEKFNQQQRVEYLQGKITEEKWLESISRRDQLYQREKSIKDILDVWLLTSGEIVLQVQRDTGGHTGFAAMRRRLEGFKKIYSWDKEIIATPPTEADRERITKALEAIKEAGTQLFNLRDYCLKDLRVVSHRYSCMVPSDIALHNYSTRYNSSGKPLHKPNSGDDLKRPAKKKAKKEEEEAKPEPMEIDGEPEKEKEKEPMEIDGEPEKEKEKEPIDVSNSDSDSDSDSDDSDSDSGSSSSSEDEEIGQKRKRKDLERC